MDERTKQLLATAKAEIAKKEQAKEVFPPNYKWNTTGQILAGQVKSLSDVPNIGLVAIVEPDDGNTVSLWLTSIILKREFTQKKIEVGDLIAVKYLGKDGRMNTFIVEKL